MYDIIKGFAKTVGSRKEGFRYRFGKVSNAQFANELRVFASRVERDEVNITQVQLLATVHPKQWSGQRLSIDFEELEETESEREQPERIIELPDDV